VTTEEVSIELNTDFSTKGLASAKIQSIGGRFARPRKEQIIEREVRD